MNRAAAKVQIRPMTAEDVDRVLEIQSELPSAPHWPRQAWMDALDSGGALRRLVIVATSEQREHTLPEETLPGIFGFAVASQITPQAELEIIAVSAGRQRLGVGRLLLGSLVEQVRQAGIEELLLEVRASNLAAIGLYRSFGFEQIGNRAGYYADPQEDAVLMSLKLKQAICGTGTEFE